METTSRLNRHPEKGSANFDYAGSIPPELFLRQFLNMEGNKILKADGSLDVDLINKLPLEEWMSVMGNLTEEQFEEYLSKTPLKESNEPMRAIEVEYTLEEEIARGCGLADELIDRWRKAGTMK